MKGVVMGIWGGFVVVVARAIVACSTIRNTCIDCGRVMPNEVECEDHIRFGVGCLPPCVGCGKVVALTTRTLDEPSPNGSDEFTVAMCVPCWVLYDGPTGDQYAWGDPVGAR
jgi:hypothetical protein